MSSFRLEDALEFSSRNVGPDDLDWDVGPRRRIEGAKRFRWGGFIDTGSLLSQRYPEDAFQEFTQGIEEEGGIDREKISPSPTPDRHSGARASMSTPGESSGQLINDATTATPPGQPRSQHSGSRQHAIYTPAHNETAEWARTATSSHMQRTAYLMEKIMNRFDPRFQILNVPTSSALERILNRGVEYCQSKAGQDIRADIAKILQAKNQEARFCDALCLYLNGIARAMVGSSYRDLFWNTGSRPLRTGTDPVYKGRTSDTNKPDIVVTCGPFVSTPNQSKPDWNQVAAVFEVKCQQPKDMDFHQLIGELIRFVTSLAEHNPMTTCLNAFSVAGQRIRLFRFDAFTYSTSLPCELDRPEDFLGLAKMIAHCVGPLDVVRPVWKPSIKTLPSLDWIDWDHVNTRTLCSRNELFGRRTAVWDLVDKSGANVVVKASWLPPDPCRHEENILKHLHAPAQHHLASVRDACDIDEFLNDHPEYQDTYDRLPLYIAHESVSANHPAVQTGIVPPRIGREDLDRLELAVLVTSGPAGRSLLNDNDEMSLREILQVFLDMLKTCRVTSRCGVCYRDVNLGNIVWERTKTGVRGRLIDWGNAIIAGLHRKDAAPVGDIVEYCQDDAHSANAYFLCRAGVENRKPAQEYLHALLEARKLPDSNTPGLSIKEQRMIQAAKDELREAEQACRKVLCQRYIDDLESCIYSLVFLILVTSRDENAAAFLADFDQKCAAWADGFEDVFHGVAVNHAFKKLLLALTREVNPVRKALARRHAVTPVGVAVTQDEDDCAANCIDLIEQCIASLPAKGFL